MSARGKSTQDIENQVSAIVSLTPSESKRLIAKAIAKFPEVKRAFKKGLIVIRPGSTTAFIVEELLGITINKSDFFSGLVTEGELAFNTSPTKLFPFLIRDGKQAPMPTDRDIVQEEFTPNDVLIKSANAVDPEGNAGILTAAEIGTGPWSVLAGARGFHLIVPVGLEKLIPSVIEATKAIPGTYRLKYSTGMPVVLFPLLKAKVVTEIQAFETLCGISATHISSGGIGGSEGSVILCLTGDEQKLDEAMKLVKAIKGEPPVAKPSRLGPLAKDFDYSAAHYHKSVWPTIGLPPLKGRLL